MFRALALILLCVGASASAQTRGWFPRETGECGWVHGRFAIYNGSGLSRIWVIGTSHMLSLRDSDDSAPDELDARKWSGRDGPINDALYGDFYV